jgi:transcriptional regulator with XRE-family HTH domain
MNPIKQRREAKGWTQSQLARRVGVGRQAVRSWEERGSLPNVQSLRKLAEVFRVDQLDLVNELLTWESAARRSWRRPP